MPGLNTPKSSRRSTRDPDKLRELFPEVWEDGRQCGLGRVPDGERLRGGLPLGFHQWPQDRRTAWAEGFSAGLAERWQS